MQSIGLSQKQLEDILAEGITGEIKMVELRQVIAKAIVANNEKIREEVYAVVTAELEDEMKRQKF